MKREQNRVVAMQKIRFKNRRILLKHTKDSVAIQTKRLISLDPLEISKDKIRFSVEAFDQIVGAYLYARKSIDSKGQKGVGE